MKKLLVALTFSAFALVASVRAGDDKAAPVKPAIPEQAQPAAPAAPVATPTVTKADTTMSCCSDGSCDAPKSAYLSPKMAAIAAK
jgi:hypothetical protein